MSDLRLPEPGDVLRRKYRVERLLGTGGMAAVFAARDEIVQRTVAIKILLPHINVDDAAVNRFVNEARAAARIHSDHVPTVFEVDVLETGAAFMAFEYLEGTDFAALLEREGPLEPARAVDYVTQALEGVAEAHALGIVHRDLKPANLFLTRRKDGTEIVKVLDFGVSKMPEGAGGVSSTASQALLGSPVYMAPEQARSAKDADARSDIWSIGVVLYALLTKSVPFPGGTVGAVILAISQRDPPPMRDFVNGVPEGLEAVVRRCLARDREQRYASVAELRRALTPFGRRPQGVSRKVPWPWIIVACAGLLLADILWLALAKQ